MHQAAVVAATFAAEWGNGDTLKEQTIGKRQDQGSLEGLAGRQREWQV